MYFFLILVFFSSFFVFHFSTIVFGLDSPLPLFPPGMDPGKLYNPLLEMSDPRAMHPNPHGPYLKKKSKCKYTDLSLFFLFFWLNFFGCGYCMYGLWVYFIRCI